MQLGVNIDHVATLRQARYARMQGHANVEPDILQAASACERAGAHGITVHLRDDARHIQRADVERLRASVMSKLNLEIGNTPGAVAAALEILPDDVCMVPENRMEVTTEGGLDVVDAGEALARSVDRLHAAGIRVSLFIDPEAAQIEAAARLGVEMVELHTGAFANESREQMRELQRLHQAAVLAHRMGLQVNAGHGINYSNIALIRSLPHVVELNIGHAIVCRALFCGLEQAVREMLAAMNAE